MAWSEALALTPILDHAWMDDTTLRRSAVPPVFGWTRCKDPDTDGVYTIADQKTDVDDLRQWSTREIVQYLLKYHLPTDSQGVANIPWTSSQITQLPNWDAPTIVSMKDGLGCPKRVG